MTNLFGNLNVLLGNGNVNFESNGCGSGNPFGQMGGYMGGFSMGNIFGDMGYGCSMPMGNIFGNMGYGFGMPMGNIFGNMGCGSTNFNFFGGGGYSHRGGGFNDLLSLAGLGLGIYAFSKLSKQEQATKAPATEQPATDKKEEEPEVK